MIFDICLVHPSRSRPEKSFKNALEWINLSGDIDIQLALSLDNNDPLIDSYMEFYNQKTCDDLDISIEWHNNNSVVDATNHAAKTSNSSILVYLSDDFKCFPNWGEILLNEFEKYSGPTLIKVDDCLQRFDTAVLTIPIMNRACYNALGYFFHPGYKSMFCDEHLYWRTRKLGFLQYAPHLKFEHCHVSVGKAQNDETYRRSAANWDQGKALFKQHQAAGFPV